VRDIRPFWQRRGLVYWLTGLGLLGCGHFATGNIAERFRVAAIAKAALPAGFDLAGSVRKKRCVDKGDMVLLRAGAVLEEACT